MIGAGSSKSGQHKLVWATRGQYKSNMPESNNSGKRGVSCSRVMSKLLLLVPALSCCCCLLANPIEAQEHKQPEGTFNLLAQKDHRTSGSVRQQMTSTSNAFTTTPTRADHHLIEVRHANDSQTNNNDEKSKQQQQQLYDNMSRTSLAASTNNYDDNGNNSTGQTTINRTTLQQQEVSELSAFEAASLGYFRHSLETSVILTIAYTIVFIVGIIGNSFVVAIVCKSPRMRTVTNYFIANLALADILVLLFCLPATLVGNLFIPYVLGLFVCKTVSYLQGVAVSASINTMVAVTLDRFLAICFPMDWHMSRRMARWTIACIWIFSMSVSLPWALFFALVPYPLPDNRIIQVCAEDWPSERWGTMYFVCANLILLYLFPATVIILCYLGIWYKIERRNIPGDRPKGLKIELIMQKSKLKVVKMMMVVVVIFLLSWLPLYLIFARIKLVEERSQWEEWLIGRMMPLAQWLGASNSCINPILYTFYNRKYKQGFIGMFKLSFCCCWPTRGRRRTSQRRPDVYSNGLLGNQHHDVTSTGRLAPSTCTNCRQQTRTLVEGRSASEHQSLNGGSETGQDRSSSRCCRRQPDMRLDSFILPAVTGRRPNQNHQIGAKGRLSAGRQQASSRVCPSRADRRASNSNTCSRKVTGGNGGGAGSCSSDLARDLAEMRPSQTRVGPNVAELATTNRFGRRQSESSKPLTCDHDLTVMAIKSEPDADGRYGSTRLHLLSGRGEPHRGELEPEMNPDKGKLYVLRATARQTPDKNKLICAQGLPTEKKGNKYCSGKRRPDNSDCLADPKSLANIHSQKPKAVKNESAQMRLSNHESLRQNFFMGSKASKDQLGQQREKNKEKSSERTKKRKRNMLLCKSKLLPRDKSLISSNRDITESTDVTAISLGTVDNPREANVSGSVDDLAAISGRQSSGSHQPSGHLDSPVGAHNDDDDNGGGGGCDVDDTCGGGARQTEPSNQDELGQSAHTGQHDDILDEGDVSDALSLGSSESNSLATTELEEEEEEDGCLNDDADDNEDREEDLDGDDGDDGDEDEGEEQEDDNLLFGSASSDEDKSVGRQRRLSLDSRADIVSTEHIGPSLAASGNSFVGLVMNGLGQGNSVGPAAARSDITLADQQPQRQFDPRRHPRAGPTVEDQPQALATAQSRSCGLDCKTSIIKNCTSASTTTLTGNHDNNKSSKQADYNV